MRLALSWARAGDVLVLPLHSRDGRGHASRSSSAAREGWKPASPYPRYAIGRDRRGPPLLSRSGARGGGVSRKLVSSDEFARETPPDPARRTAHGAGSADVA